MDNMPITPDIDMRLRPESLFSRALMHRCFQWARQSFATTICSLPITI